MSGTVSELASHCIRCGFCLESCPTFVITGDEASSPRGRIYLIRSADEGTLDWEATCEHLESCVGCRACETACPSGVEYGSLLELSRAQLIRNRPDPGRETFLDRLTNPSLARLQFGLASLLPGRKVPRFLARQLSAEPSQALVPILQKTPNYPPLDEGKLPPIRAEVTLLEGCAMRVLFPGVHEATRRLLRRVGVQVRRTDLGCCGALHAHAGFLDVGKSRAAAVSKRAEGLPVIVNSAGCGAWLKEAQSAHVFDLSEYLEIQGFGELLSKTRWKGPAVTYHDACHLAHGQKITAAPRNLLRAIAGLELTELEEADRCCGSAGIYNLTQPHLAKTMLDRKWRFVEQTGAGIVITGNPGCHAWLEQAARAHGKRIEVLHTAEALERAFAAH